ncbi:hypothetical protein [Sporosarcina sp. BP05]|uniref:hypothetical protein n=1 Tax=Sporosarcina sp. BP05 TaxID=2758726 RepID=UPI001645BA8F|nr:hypothetical protein [Sporosarcina sp. BP05]
MSKNRIPNCINEIQPNYSLPDLEGFIDYIPFSSISPIDEFKEAFTKLIQLGSSDYFQNFRDISSGLILSLISLTENYFRNILTRTILICPVSQIASSNQNINIGSVLWHGGNNIIHGVFENISFASGKEVKNASLKYLEFQIPKNSLLESIFNEYDKICNLRHAIVHSDGFLAGKNATALAISKVDTKVRVKLEFAAFQEIGVLCLTLVTNYNDELFKELCERWSLVWRREYGITVTNEEEKFVEMWSTFVSSVDQLNGVISNEMSMVDCMQQIKSIYQLI